MELEGPSTLRWDKQGWVVRTLVALAALRPPSALDVSPAELPGFTMLWGAGH